VFAAQDGGIGVGLFYSNLLFTTRGVQDFVQAANIQVKHLLPRGVGLRLHAVVLVLLERTIDRHGAGQRPGAHADQCVPRRVAFGEHGTVGWSVDDIQIYQGALSASEVAMLFANPGLAFNNTATAVLHGENQFTGLHAADRLRGRGPTRMSPADS